MVDDLPDPLAFQAELRQGRLLALHGDAYGQDTRAIDFARVAYDQVFTLDEQGESIAFDPAALMQPSPLLDLHQHADHEPPHPVDPPLNNLGAPQQVQRSGPQTLVDVVFGKVEPASREAAADETPPGKADQTTVLIGLWVGIAVVALLAVVLFDFSIFFAVFFAGIVGRMLHKPKVLAALTRATRRLGQYEYRPPQQ